MDGSVFIDNTNVKKIPLKVLREKIAVLPQTPVLFPLSVRKNLDPLGKFDDESIWSVLQKCEMKRHFNSLDITLDQNKFSSGQRQLLCLARAMLVVEKILILDEATSNVDPNTEAVIQNTIKDHFAKCTVLAISHRSSALTNCDLILVIDHGKIV